MAFEVHGSKGALRWNFERMNELELFLPGESDTQDGYVCLNSGPDYPFHDRFNPGPAMGLGYDDLKVIEAHQFLQSVLHGEQQQPGFAEALAVARVQAAIMRSWERDPWGKIVA
jgi:predicted dehydrogenase